MPSSTGLLTPRGPFSGAAPLALRPLSAIAASTAGGVPETRIKRLLSDLLPSLIALHAQGEICGDISLETVGMDEGARAHLLPELVVARSRRASRSPAPGFAPFELYSDSMEWPRGPWSDVYALCAVMHALVTGHRPPPAPERRATDNYEPLASQGLSKYNPDFLIVIDAGLSMAPADRPQTLAELAALLGVAAYIEPAPAEADVAAGAAYAPPPAAPAAKPAGGRRPLLGLLCVAALIGMGTYAWFHWGMGTPNVLITSSELVQPNPPAVYPAPQVTLPPVAPAAPLPTAQWQPSAPVPSQPEPAPATKDSSAAESPPALSAETSDPAAQAPAAAAPAAADEAPKPKPLAVPVTVRLDIRPWGEVWINGIARGISPPVKELRLIPGKYQVVLRNADLPPYRGTLEIKAGKPGVISHTFQ
ncbi:serine/threonine protein kinase [Achromobacter sp. UMC46]|uniref:serine/threonine protein kinase n=1 Tax=Achromobacter sp. UMC46 TaxID=1862319 RepID=UPI0016013870|nr:serine/threonine protein kinase [Achromobacter sp. UMC46]MBB1598041.1 serine/threonine protein kinase [Achromobacter sp. UMC46]